MISQTEIQKNDVLRVREEDYQSVCNDDFNIKVVSDESKISVSVPYISVAVLGYTVTPSIGFMH